MTTSRVSPSRWLARTNQSAAVGPDIEKLDRKRNKLKTMLLPLLALLLLPSGALGQSQILRLMQKQADVIARVKILDSEHGVSINSIGSWDTVVALCVVVEPIKGSLKKGEQFRFSYYRSLKSEGKRKPGLVEKGKDLIVFMTSTQMAKQTDTSGQVTEVLFGELIDKWVGVIHYQPALVDLLQRMTGKQERVQQNAPADADKPRRRHTKAQARDIYAWRDNNGVLRIVARWKWPDWPRTTRFIYPCFASDGKSLVLCYQSIRFGARQEAQFGGGEVQLEFTGAPEDLSIFLLSPGKPFELREVGLSKVVPSWSGGETVRWQWGKHPAQWCYQMPGQ